MQEDQDLQETNANDNYLETEVAKQVAGLKKNRDRLLREKKALKDQIESLQSGLKQEGMQEISAALREAREQVTALREEVGRMEVDQFITQEAVKRGVRAEAMPDLLSRANQMMWKKTEDQKIVAFVDDATPLYAPTGENKMQVTDWLDIVTKDAPHLFRSSQGGGAGPSVNGVKNIFRPTKLEDIAAQGF